MEYGLDPSSDRTDLLRRSKMPCMETGLAGGGGRAAVASATLTQPAFSHISRIGPGQPIEEMRKALTTMEGMQREIWKFGDINITGSFLLEVLATRGGQMLAAYDVNGRMIAFSQAYLAKDAKTGEIYLHSDLVGVLEEYRSAQLGYHIKMQQREEALKDGFSRIDWTFDPMESLNANLNVRKLRAHVVDFKPNLYGEVASDLIGGLPTHRFLVRWNLNQSIAPTADANIPPSIIEVDGKPELTVEDPSTLGNLVSVMTVRDYQGLKHKNMPLARIWQEKVCAAAAALLKAGFHGTGFRDLPGDGRCLYLFEKQNA